MFYLSTFLMKTDELIVYYYYFFVFIYLFILLFRAAPTAYGGSQARGPIRATAAGLHHSHSRSEMCVRPTPQLMATQDP